MTEADIQALQQDLLDTAQAIQTYQGLVAQNSLERDEKREAKELRKAQILAQIAADRLLYRNAEQRQAALVEQTALDAQYQTARSEELTAEQQKLNAEISVEFNRRKYRANELLLLYYANQPGQ